LKNDAIGSCVSGAGPTVLVLYDDNTNLDKIKVESLEVCKAFGLACNFILAQIAGGVKSERLD
jgi:homoserine kinase